MINETLQQTIKSCDNFNDFADNHMDEFLDFSENKNRISRNEMFKDDAIREARETYDEIVGNGFPF